MTTCDSVIEMGDGLLSVIKIMKNTSNQFQFELWKKWRKLKKSHQRTSVQLVEIICRKKW